jgi:polyphosphate kinase
MAPQSLKNKLLNLINRETERSSADTPGYIKAKMNSLSDSDVIRALYKASQSHVNIELNVRGICMLVPGVKGVSENITVVSIVDRFLEHSRIFYFYNSGDEEIYLSSADWMPRNLERRVELMFPVEDPAIRERLKKALSVFLSDNMQSWELISDGSYKRRQSPSEDQPLRAQQWFYESALQSESRTRMSPKRDFTVRRKPPEKRR